VVYLVVRISIFLCELVRIPRENRVCDLLAIILTDVQGLFSEAVALNVRNLHCTCTGMSYLALKFYFQALK